MRKLTLRITDLIGNRIYERSGEIGVNSRDVLDRRYGIVRWQSTEMGEKIFVEEVRKARSNLGEAESILDYIERLFMVAEGDDPHLEIPHDGQGSHYKLEVIID